MSTAEASVTTVAEDPRFVLSPAVPSSLYRFAEISAASFAADQLRLAEFAGVADGPYAAWVAAALAAPAAPPGMHAVIVQTARADTGALVGYARWLCPSESSSPETTEDLSPAPATVPTLPQGADLDGYAIRKRMSNAVWQRLLAGRSHYVLSFLAVDPSAQRTGAGTALVRWGTERADADGLPIFVSASLVAAPLYERLGWETKDLGMVRYPITGMEVLLTYMVREPRPPKDDR